MRVFRAQLGLICVGQIQVWPYLSVDEQREFLDRMDFDAIFQQINLRYQWAMWVYTPEIQLYANFQTIFLLVPIF